jgi:predicted amidohydrolase YtcJ
MRFIDAHTHLEFFALKGIPLDKAATKKDVIDMIESSSLKPLAAWGWSEETIGESITREDIDRFPFPILLIRVDAHVGVINKSVMDELEIESSGKFDPERGYVYEDVLWNIASILKPKDLRASLLRAQDEAVSKGVIEVHDFVDANIAETYFKLREEGCLKLKVKLMPYYDHYEDVLSLFDKFAEDECLKLGWVKAFVDGSIGARTAYLREPYIDKPSNGILLKTVGQLESMIRELENKGLRISLHAIGDGAIDVCLGAFERADIKLKGHRIEHAEMIDLEQAKRAKDLNVTLCVQPNFNVTFMKTYMKALGEERAKRMNPIKMLDELGVPMIFGSDMMPFDPEIGLTYASQILGGEKALFYYGGWRDKIGLT